MSRQSAYSVNIFLPGGNTTAIITGPIPDPDVRNRINSAILTRYTDVEQVGFLDDRKNTPVLMMAGGEFCGNATRSAAWLLCSGKPTNLRISVPSIGRTLRAGVKHGGSAFAQMPVPEQIIPLQASSDRDFIVYLPGIVHLVSLTMPGKNVPRSVIKRTAINRLNKLRLTQYSACAVTYASVQSGQWNILPVVFVRSIKTLFLETACGSGSIALACVLPELQIAGRTTLQVIQPSGSVIHASVLRSQSAIADAEISGPVEPIQLNSSITVSL